MVLQGIVGGVDNTKIRLYTKLEKSKETVRILQRNSKKCYDNIWMVKHNKVNVKLSNL